MEKGLEGIVRLIGMTICLLAGILLPEVPQLLLKEGGYIQSKLLSLAAELHGQGPPALTPLV